MSGSYMKEISLSLVAMHEIQFVYMMREWEIFIRIG